jgi:hypothetical protein
MAPATRSTEGSRAVVGVLYPEYHGSLVTTHNSGYDRFPPAANGWGTTHSIPNMSPPLLGEGEGTPT